jgi:hypothetical protein
MKRERRG